MRTLWIGGSLLYKNSCSAKLKGQKLNKKLEYTFEFINFATSEYNTDKHNTQTLWQGNRNSVRQLLRAQLLVKLS